MARKKPKRVSPRRAERINRVLQYVMGGASFRQIAQSEGVSVSTVHADYEDGIRLSFQASADALRETELQRLDRMHMAIWKQATDKDAPDLEAIRTILQIQARRAIYTGLNEPPTQNDVNAVQSLLEQLTEEHANE